MDYPVSLDSIKDVSLFQKKKGYRFTIDSVLLADFVNRLNPSTIMDIGAGNGIIGILLARRFPSAFVTLLELQEDLSVISEKNVVHNDLTKQVTVRNMDIGEIRDSSLFTPASFDVVVSNPPFRVPMTGKISPYDEKAIARHEIKMDACTLMGSTAYLLKPKGYFYGIFHPFRLMEIVDNMRKFFLEPKRIRFIYPNIGSESKMVMVEAVKGARQGLKVENPLIIYGAGSVYTEEVLGILNK